MTNKVKLDYSAVVRFIRSHEIDMMKQVHDGARNQLRIKPSRLRFSWMGRPSHKLR